MYVNVDEIDGRVLSAEPPEAGQTVTAELVPSPERTAMSSSAPLIVHSLVTAVATAMTSVTAGGKWHGTLLTTTLIRILAEFLQNLGRETRPRLPSIVIKKPDVQSYESIT